LMRVFSSSLAKATVILAAEADLVKEIAG
jgi:hypothetical protein